MKQNEIISYNLKRLFEMTNTQPADMAKKTGISESSISGYINGKVVPRMGKIQQMANFFGVNNTEITNYNLDDSKIIPIQNFTFIPILGSIPCGNPADKEPEHVGDLLIEKKDVRGGDYFALYADGDSMYPTIQNGETVVVRKQPVAENGDLVAACVEGEITLKRFKLVGDTPLLVPDNPKYEPINLNDSDCTYIVGKVTKAINIRNF